MTGVSAIGIDSRRSYPSSRRLVIPWLRREESNIFVLGWKREGAFRLDILVNSSLEPRSGRDDNASVAGAQEVVDNRIGVLKGNALSPQAFAAPIVWVRDVRMFIVHEPH